jgi:replication initiation protein RepC
MGIPDAGRSDPTQRASLPEETTKGSPTSEAGFVPYKSTTQPFHDLSSRSDTGFQKSVVEPSAPWDPVTCSGQTHVSLGMAVSVAGRRLAERLPAEPDWGHVVAAAYALRGELGVSQASWGEACAVLGRTGAALCLLVTDRAVDRDVDPVRQPAAYFRGLVRRARAGELRLHSSVFGLLEGAQS